MYGNGTEVELGTLGPMSALVSIKVARKGPLLSQLLGASALRAAGPSAFSGGDQLGKNL